MQLENRLFPLRPPPPESGNDDVILAQLKKKLKHQLATAEKWKSRLLLDPLPSPDAKRRFSASSKVTDGSSNFTPSLASSTPSLATKFQPLPSLMSSTSAITRKPQPPDEANTVATPSTTDSRTARGVVGIAQALKREQQTQSQHRPELTHGKFCQEFLSYIRMEPAHLMGITNPLINKYKVTSFLGSGGSGVVLKGEVLVPDIDTGLAVGDTVAIKIFVHNKNTKEMLKAAFVEFGFHSLLSSLDDAQIYRNMKLFDIILSTKKFQGMDELLDSQRQNATTGENHNTSGVLQLSDLELAYNGTPVLALVLEYTDGVKGKFAEPDDDEYDDMYDTVLNTPFSDAEVFQFIYLQLVAVIHLQYKAYDLMLNGQLRGDNLGYKEYKDTNIAFQVPFAEDKYVLFRCPEKFIYVLDVGQGTQPNIAALHDEGMIGEPVAESCLVDDGFGRYWDRDSLYTPYETEKEFGGTIAKWAAEQTVHTPDQAERVLWELFQQYMEGGYSVDKQVVMEMKQENKVTILRSFDPTISQILHPLIPGKRMSRTGSAIRERIY